MMGYKMLRAWADLSAWLERHDAGGWAMMLAGLLALGVLMLSPERVKLEQARARHAAIETRQAAAELKRTTYAQLLEQLDRGDGRVLRQLAWHQLHVKPIDIEPLDARPAGSRTATTLDQRIDRRAAQLQQEPPSPPAAPTRASHRLIAWSSGPYRPHLLIAACLLIGLGLLGSLRPRPDP